MLCAEQQRGGDALENVGGRNFGRKFARRPPRLKERGGPPDSEIRASQCENSARGNIPVGIGKKHQSFQFGPSARENSNWEKSAHFPNSAKNIPCSRGPLRIFEFGWSFDSGRILGLEGPPPFSAQLASLRISPPLLRSAASLAVFSHFLCFILSTNVSPYSLHLLL